MTSRIDFGRTSTVSVLLFLILQLAGDIAAQELKKNSAPTPDKTDTAVTERVRLLESELERTNTKLEQLRRTIEDQQHAISTLLEKLSMEPAKAASDIPATLSAPVVTPAKSPQPQDISVEQRLGRVEGQTLRVGPLRVSGDFRLRFDGTFRSASAPLEPPLQHVQNSRMRYRLRLNFDTDLYPTLSFHGQLATGAINNPLTADQDFGATTARHPLFINEAWIDYHPSKAIQLQAGRLQEIFADNSRFLFDDDIRFNGFNEKYTATLESKPADISSIEFRAGQYILTNPNLAVIAPNSPLAHAGEMVGSTGRSANLFHQGVLINQQFNNHWSDQLGGDIQLYRNPNQIQLASTTEGLVLLIQPGLGLALSGPLTGNGTATTTPGGVIYTAPGFRIARLTYRLNYAGFESGGHAYPLIFNVQLARNVATGLKERDAILAALQLGRITKRGDTSFLYVFSIKGANSMISQVTDDDLGTGTGVNIRSNHFRFEYGIAKKVTFQALLYLQKQLRNSGSYPNFFVPLGAFAPRTYRIQPQLVFSF
ncbi:MAG: putative porin [Pyrinomonadaceae bacterium]